MAKNKYKQNARKVSDTCAPAEQPFVLPCILLWAMMALLILLQGGFYAGTTAPVMILGCVAGLVAFAVALHRSRAYGERIQVSPAGLVALPCCLFAAAMMLASAFANSWNITAEMSAGMYLCFAGILACCLLVHAVDRARLLRGVCWIGIVAAALFVLMYAGVIPYPGALEGDRLQGTFQYANTCGAFMGAIALLCISSEDERISHLATLPAATLLLTQSGGAIVVTALCALGWAIVRLRASVKGDDAAAPAVAAALLQFAAAVIALVAALALSRQVGVVAVAVVAAVVAAFLILEKTNLAAVVGRLRIVIAALIVLAAIACVAAAVLMPARLQQAGQTLLERAVQIHDGACLLAMVSPFGVGPDQWQFAYPFIQTAQYRAASIHCGPLQFALDGGFVACAALIAAAACGFVGCVRAREVGGCAALAVIALHCLIDFDLRFMAMALLFSVIAFGGTGSSRSQENADSVSASKFPVRAAFLIPLCLAVGIIGGALSLHGSASLTQMQGAAQSGDAQAVREIFQTNAAAQSDPYAQSLYLQALCDGGDYQTAAEWAPQHEMALDQASLYAAKALYESGQPQKGAEQLIAQLAAQPGNFAFFEAAHNFFEAYGVPENQEGAYTQAIAKANELATSARELGLQSQEPVM